MQGRALTAQIRVGALYVIGDKGAAASLKKLGKHKVSGGCLHIAKLADVDQAVLREMVRSAYAYVSAKRS